MHSDQQPYRQLHDDMLWYEGKALYDDLLRPWLRSQDKQRCWLAQVRKREGDPVPPMQQEDLWRLYALARILDLLQLSFAPCAEHAAWRISAISRDEYARFLDALGLEPLEHAEFHPFLHEVVTVDQLAEDRAAPKVVEVYWPGCSLGPLLISRVGCRVEAGRGHMVKEIAERSTLYWAYARNNRNAEDLSTGWGSNSQWRTDFRRDYMLEDRLYYNVDATGQDDGEPDLDEAESLELLRHRCFVTCGKPSEDRCPYDLSLTEGT